MQTRGGILRRQERDLIALGRLADRHRDGALIGADEGRDLVLRDQALGLGAPLLRIALVVGDDDLHLGAAQALQPHALAERKIEIMRVVDHVERRVEGVLRVDADLSARARHLIERPDHHL